MDANAVVNVPQAVSITGLIAVLWPIFRTIERRIPSARNNLREDINGLDSRINRLERNKAEREDVEQLGKRITDAETNILRLQRRPRYD